MLRVASPRVHNGHESKGADEEVRTKFFFLEGFPEWCVGGGCFSQSQFYVCNAIVASD